MKNDQNEMWEALEKERNRWHTDDDNSSGGRGNHSGGGGMAAIIVVLMLIIVILIAFMVSAFCGDSTDTAKESVTTEKTGDSKQSNIRLKNILGGNNGDESEFEENEEDETADGKEKGKGKNNSVIEDSVLRSYMNAYTNYTDYGIVVDNLTTGYSYSYNRDKTFLSSALSQIVILDAMSDICFQQDVDLDDETWYFSYLHNGKENPNSKYQDGKLLNLRAYIEDIAVYGDNNKSNAMVDWIGYRTNRTNGFDTINSNLRKKGYSDTLISRKIFTNSALIDTSVPANVTTPEDISCIFDYVIRDSSFGNEYYMKKLFKCLDSEGKALGLKKYVPSYYSVSDVNACNAEVDHDVMLIENGGTEVLVVIMSQTDSSKTKIETSKDRNNARQAMLGYILDTQFNGD